MTWKEWLDSLLHPKKPPVVPPDPVTRNVEMNVTPDAWGVVHTDDGRTYTAQSADNLMVFTIPFKQAGGADLHLTLSGYRAWAGRVVMDAVLHAPVVLQVVVPIPPVVPPVDPPADKFFPDMIPASSVEVINTFEDMLRWPVQVNIERLWLDPQTGINVQYSNTDMWPDHHLDNSPEAGYVRFTLCAGFQIQGRWVMSAFFEFWAHEGRPRHDTGAHPLMKADDGKTNNWQANWADPRWGKLHDIIPHDGQQMAVCLVAGSARLRKHKTVEGRSQIVTFPLALSGEQVVKQS